jgi:hypothetical protein
MRATAGNRDSSVAMESALLVDPTDLDTQDIVAIAGHQELLLDFRVRAERSFVAEETFLRLALQFHLHGRDHAFVRRDPRDDGRLRTQPRRKLRRLRAFDTIRAV